MTDSEQISSALLAARRLTEQLILGHKVSRETIDALDTKLKRALEIVDRAPAQ
jgi:hypothetical protein